MEFQTLKEAKEHLKSKLSTGIQCPCCGQYARMYNRKITSIMASGLIKIYKENKKIGLDKFVYLPKLLTEKKFGDISKVMYWKLVEQMDSKREDGSSRVGYYKITERGIDFVEGKIAIEKYAYIYNNVIYGFSENDKVTINECLREKFDYEELMMPSGQQLDIKL